MSDVSGAEARPVAIAPRVLRHHPLTRTQAQIWSSQRLHPDAPIANMGKRHRIAGAVDPERFVRAVDIVVRSSDGLRTMVVAAPGRDPEVRVAVEPTSTTDVIDLAADDLDRWSDERIARPIDATAGSYDSVLLRHAEDDWTWWFDLHHVATDAASSAVVYDAVASVYEALGAPAATDGGAVDGSAGAESLDLVAIDRHLAALEDAVDPDRRDRRHGEWSEILAEIEPMGPISPYGPRGPRTTRVARLPVRIPEGLTAALEGPFRTVSRELGLLGLLVSNVAVLLQRLDGRPTVVVGIPIHHRSGRRARRVVGPLMEIYPMPVTIDPAEDFAALFSRVHADLVALLRRAKPGESPEVGVDAIVNVVTATYSDFAGLPTVTEWTRSGHVDPAHPIRVQAYDYGAELRIELDLNEGLSTDGSHDAMPDHFAIVLDRATAEPATGIGDFDILTERDRTVLARLVPPAPSRADGRPVHERIREVLRANPDHVVATRDDANQNGAELTALELDRGADVVARQLVAEGVGRGDRVGIRMRRGFDVLVAVHGVLRAGAVFVMLDPDHPVARHEVIRDDADLALILDEVTAVSSEDMSREAVESNVTLPTVELDDPAYVLYTSGSTGEPKGVPISHRGLADYLDVALDAYVEDEPPVMALHSALVFDLTITSLFLPQLAGGRTVIVGDDGVPGLSRLAADTEVTLLKATPSQLELIARMATDPLPVRTVVVGGEAFRRPTAEAFAAACRPGVRIFNEYGPTEAVVGCMIHEWDPRRDRGADVPIGVATPGAALAVLDRVGRPTPPGAWGELYVRRPGMAAGYLNRPVLTAERFAPKAPLGPEPAYRTGDRVRVESGVLVFGGRLDDQLAIGGIRLEPGEVESALVTHPGVANAVVRVWTPGDRSRRLARCVRCGLGTDVPGLRVDDRGVCSVCAEFDRVQPQTTAWFKTEGDLDEELMRSRSARTGEYDCLHLLSGGKDSTYALYQLVERGWKVHALTLDNGFISDGAKDNVGRSVAELGISHEFVTTSAMNEIFRDSLERYANVCNGCYKTIYTLAVARAGELGIPTIVTGLSRGQFFETRLVPHQFESDRFDPAAIDATVLQARRTYHHTPDAVTRLLPEQSVFERDDVDVLSEIEFVDFYRFVDVELADMYTFLEERAPWVRPADTGRSTNCLINAAGIHVHRTERGYHNYAEPYSWDVRLGHKTRDEALEELDDEFDLAEIHRMLAEVGYEPAPGSILTAWYQTTDPNVIVAPDELRDHLRGVLPAHAVPGAFVRVDEIPLAASAKVDVAALPAPTRFGRDDVDLVAPSTATEIALAELWSTLLGVERIGVDDDFFDLGGASLAALEMVALVDRRFSIDLDDAAVFRHRTIAELSVVVDEARAAASVDPLDIEPEPTPVTIPRRGDAPVSRGQRSLLFDVLAEPESPRYGVTRHYRFGDAGFDHHLEPRRIHDALRQVVARHDTMRWTFTEPRRLLPVDEALAWEVESVSSVDSAADVAQATARRPFDVLDGPRLRATWLVAPDGPHLVLSLHHLWCDASSFDVLWRDLASAIDGSLEPEPPVRYADHAAWQAERTDEHRAWFTDLLADVDEVPDLSIPAPAVPEPDGYVRRSVELPGGGRRSLFSSFVAAVDVVLSAYGDGRSVVGVPMTVRDVPEADEIVGYFLNTVPLPLPDVSGTFADVVGRTESLLASAIRHRTFPYAEVVRDRTQQGRDTDLARIMVVHDPPSAATLPGLPATGETVFNGAAVTDLSFLVTETESGCEIAAEWSGRRFARAAVDDLLDQLERVISRGCAEPATDAASLIVRTPALFGRSLEPSDAPIGGTVLDRIWSGDRRRAGKPAIRAGERTVDTDQLLRLADSVAVALVARGVSTNDRVALLLDRSIEQVVAVLGVLRAGATYVPIDPRYPAQRIAELLAGSAPRLVIVDGDGVGSRTGDVESAPLDELLPSGDESSPIADADRLPMPSADDGAYVIFTSGTTGTPRGVLVGHGQLAFSTGARDAIYPDAPSRFLWTSSYGFDSSIVGLFWTLAIGGELVLPEPDRAADVDHLIDEIERRSITHLLTVPSLWSAVLARAGSPVAGAALGSLTDVIVAGEAVQAATVEAHHRHIRDCRLWNEYGPTEATVWSSVHLCRQGEDPVPIGGPIPGGRLRIVTSDGRDVPLGAAGELWIGGPNVTDGYLADRAATEERFVADDDGRWYRSGDRVVVDGDRLVFLGRVDEQLSVNGVRLEPTEVERVVAGVEGVVAAAVVVAPSGLRDELVAFVVVDDGCDEAVVDAVRSAIGVAVPATIAPARYILVDELPRTPHGKLDRRAAGELARRDQAPSTLRTATSTERPLDRLVAIWSEVLGRVDLDADADFFDVGGDSLAAVELVVSVEEQLGETLTITGLINGRTPAGVAELMGLADAAAAVESPSIPPGDRLVVLHPGDDGVVPTIVHVPAWDDVFGYVPLVDAISDASAAKRTGIPRQIALHYRPEARHHVERAASSDEAIRTVDELAAVFVDDLRAAGVSGRIVVLGWSTSGLVAYEVARLLAAPEADGIDVTELVLVDTYFPGEEKKLWSNRLSKYAPLVKQVRVGELAREVRVTARRRTKRIAGALGRRLVAWSDPAASRPTTAASVSTANPDEAFDYEPPMATVPTVLYAASTTNRSRTVEPWSDAVPDLTVVPIEGRHRGFDSVMGVGRVDQIANDLVSRHEFGDSH